MLTPFTWRLCCPHLFTNSSHSCTVYVTKHFYFDDSSVFTSTCIAPVTCCLFLARAGRRQSLVIMFISFISLRFSLLEREEVSLMYRAIGWSPHDDYRHYIYQQFTRRVRSKVLAGDLPRQHYASTFCAYLRMLLLRHNFAPPRKPACSSFFV